MSSGTPAPRRPRHLRIFLLSLAVLVVGVAVFIFGVSMEATSTAGGHVTARGTVEVRAPVAGRIVPDWSERARSELLKPGDEVKRGDILVGLTVGEAVTTVH